MVGPGLAQLDVTANARAGLAERVHDGRGPFPNWNGKRDTSTLTETVTGDVMTEHLDDGEGVVITISFAREQRPA